MQVTPMSTMKKKTLMLVMGSVVAALVPRLSIAKVTITGTTGEYVNKEMSLFECRDGLPLLLATTQVAADGTFSITAETPQVGFYLLGCKGGVRHSLYLTGDETLQVQFTNYQLTIRQGAGSACLLLSEWEKEAAPVRAHAWFFRSTDGCESVDAAQFEREAASLQSCADRLSPRLKRMTAADESFAALMQLKTETDQAFLRLAYQCSHPGETTDGFVTADHWKRADHLFRQPLLAQLPLAPEMMGVYVEGKAALLLPPLANPAALSDRDYQARAALIAHPSLRQSYIYDVASHLRYYEHYSELCEAFRSEPFSQRMMQVLKPIEPSLAWSKPGTAAPDFKGITPNDKWLALSDLRGRVVVIDVWATWCAPCLRMMPYFRELEKELADPDLAFLSVCVGASPEKDLWLKLVNDHHLSGNVVFVDSWTRGFAEDFKVTNVPRFIIIDRQGRVYSYAAPAPKYPQLKVMILQALAVR